MIAHVRAKERLQQLKDPHTVLPDETVSNKGRTIKLGDTTVELKYVGLNHSEFDARHAPAERKNYLRCRSHPRRPGAGRGMIDFYPIEAEASIQKIIAMDWERLIPGHPGAGGRLGTKQDAEDQLAFFQDASREVQKAAREGKCWDTVEKEMKLPKYAAWGGYENNLPFVLRRYCGLWGRGT